MTTAATGRAMGQSVQRREDPRLLTGRGRYIEDITLPGMLHAAFLRSEVARGRITHLDVEPARQLEGVYAVYTADDLNDKVKETWVTLAGPDAPYPPPYALAQGDVRYVGDPIAIVVAESRYIAEDAVELIDLELEPQEPLLDPASVAERTDEFVHAEIGTNTPDTLPPPENPALDEAFEQAANVVEATFGEHRYIAVPMEPRGIIASWDPSSGQLDLYCSTQAVHEMRAFYARLLGIPDSNVRAQRPDVGGGFGLKVFALRDEWAVVLAAVQLGGTVRWIEDRRENLIASAHARDERFTISAAVDGEGQIQALRAHNLENIGAYQYPSGSSGTARLVSVFLTGPYKIANTQVSAQTVYTNTCGKAPYRGPFLIETVGPEQLMDVVARRIGVDPLELRRRQVIRSEDLPYTLPAGLPYTDITPAETLEQAAEMIDYDGFRREQAAAREQGRLLGIGISLCVEPSAIAFGPMASEAVTLRMNAAGKVTLVVSSSDTGMSVETTMPQVVADRLGCDVADVAFFQGDTMAAPYGSGTQGSRSAVLYGNAAADAALQLRDKLLAIAAHTLEAAPEDLEVVDDGRVAVKGDPGKALSFAEIARTAYVATDALPPGMTPGLEFAARFKAPPFTMSNACHMCTVEIDRDTGLVHILRYVVSEDCGKMINPKVVEGQVYGGVVQGIGGVLYEHMVYDDAGNPLSSTLMDYLLPTTGEVPRIEIGHIESAADNPLGVKGMGEGGAIAAPAAVFNAVADALAPLGIEVRDTPLGPAQILALLESADGGSPAHE